MERLVWRRWWSVVQGGLIGGLALAALAAAPGPSSASGSQPTYGDYGDAPDTVRDGRTMPAHPFSDPSLIAGYPTVVLDDLRQVSGPWHRQPWARMWLGQGVDSEANADTLSPSSTPVPNIAAQTMDTVAASNNDAFDDGLADSGIYLPDCGTTSFSYIASGAPTVGEQSATVNVWFDWNRNGKWGDTLECVAADGSTLSVPEWAVMNQQIRVQRASVLSTPLFASIHAGIADHIWMRITITESPLPLLFADGRGPAGGHAYGETEDYALALPPLGAGLLPAASDGGTYEPDVSYYDGY